jgi:hypothetical protein
MRQHDKKNNVPWMQRDLNDETKLASKKPPLKPSEKQHASNVITLEKCKRRKRSEQGDGRSLFTHFY